MGTEAESGMEVLQSLFGAAQRAEVDFAQAVGRQSASTSNSIETIDEALDLVAKCQSCYHAFILEAAEMLCESRSGEANAKVHYWVASSEFL